MTDTTALSQQRGLITNSGNLNAQCGAAAHNLKLIVKIP